MTDPRAQFQTLLDRHNEPFDVSAFQSALELEILDLHRERFPRRKAARNRIPLKGPDRWPAILKMAKKAFPEDFDRICDEHRTVADKKMDEYLDRKKALGEELDKLAETLVPQPGDEWIKVREVSNTDYHTQGFGATTYARGAATRHCFMIQIQDIEAEVRERKGRKTQAPYPYRAFSQILYFEVWAKCSKLDYEIVKRRPAMTLKEQLQWCWNQGLNPRVFDPMLPHGLEEKLGVSYLPVPDRKEGT